MTTCVYKFEIPDLTRPIAGATEMSPSGALQPFIPAPLAPEDVTGRRIADVCTAAGTYGMGGPGFFALQLGEDWLVIALWGAASWMTCQGRLVEDWFYDTSGRPAPWLVGEADRFSPAITGQTISAIDIRRTSLCIGLSNGLDLSIDADPTSRPAFAGNDQPRAFTADDDLRRAVFLSPTTELWI